MRRRHWRHAQRGSLASAGKELTLVTIRNERPADVVAREALLDTAYGPARFTKTSERLREGRRPAEQLSFVATERGLVIGTVRLWHVWAGAGRAALLLGPLAVHPECRNRGIGSKLMRRAVMEARRLGHAAVLLVGDAPYYGRFGFGAEKTSALWMPGHYERDRLLALELAPGALAGARGLIGAAGELAPKPDLTVLVAALESGVGACPVRKTGNHFSRTCAGGGRRDVMPRAA
jgi:predicted N-acetyltransferase YhbS